MKRSGILNSELSHALASMGHTDILIIADVGFPIPKDAWRIDLAIADGYPDHVKILEIIAREFIAEKIMFAQEVVNNNQPLYREYQRLFSDAEFEPIPAERMLNEIAFKAKAIVRTGGYVPWGNTALVAGTDPFKFFSDPEIVVPPFYQKRFEMMKKTREQS